MRTERQMTAREAGKLTQLSFDYDAHEISKADSQALEKNAAAIVNETVALWKRTTEYVFKVAEHLNDAHERLANHKNGTFGKWVEQRCGMSERSARQIRSAANYFRQILPDKVQIDPSAMYLLSADSCPEEATQEAIAIAKTGKRITHSLAKEIKSRYVDESKEPSDIHGKIAEIEKKYRAIAEIDRTLALMSLRVLLQELEDDAS